MNIELNLNGTIIQQTEQRLNRALLKGAEFLLTESIKTAPKDEGLLIQSGLVSNDTTNHVAVVSYNTPYAVRLHENPQYRFQNGRRGKWLEQTLNEQKQTMLNLIADDLRGLLR